MVRIRLRRIGAKRQPSYRIIVADSEAPRDGSFIERIGFYNPRTEPGTVEIDEGRALYWLNVGAQPSASVRQILTRCGTWERFRRLKAGEALETLLEEARQATEAKAAVDARTRLRPQAVAPKPTAQVEEAAAE